MGSTSTHYSHAAPYIRRRLIEEIATTLSARTQRDRAAGWKAVGAYATCLSIMRDSTDQTFVDGVPNIDSAPIEALRETLRYFGAYVAERMGEQGAADIKARIDEFDAIQARHR